MITEYVLFNMSPTKKEVVKADMALLKANLNDQFAERMRKIKHDRNISWKIVNSIGAVMKRTSGVDIIGLTAESLVSNVEMINRIGAFDYSIEELDSTTVKLTVNINEFLNEAEALGLGMIDRFKSTKRMDDHIERAVKSEYTQKYERKPIQK